jgi:hypothetical protein
MKKNLFFALVALTSVLLLSSCKKDDCSAPPAPIYPVEGFWVGKYGSGTAAPSSGYSMVVEPGGTLTVADGSTISASSKAAGTWTLNGNVFKATYTYSGGGPTYSIQANWTNDGKMVAGTWGPGNTPTGSGTWFMDRKN